MIQVEAATGQTLDHTLVGELQDALVSQIGVFSQHT
jgi:hypothetical protein